MFKFDAIKENKGILRDYTRKILKIYNERLFFVILGLWYSPFVLKKYFIFKS